MALPELISRLAARLEEAPDQVLAMQESAARGGAQWALSLLLSWYPDAELEVFNEGPRAGTSYSELSQLDGVRRAASTIADFIDFDEFVPPYDDSKGKAKLDEGVGGGEEDPRAASHPCRHVHLPADAAGGAGSVWP